MTWVTISGPGTTTATKFHGDALNKVDDLFNGTDISDTVTIHANTLWTMGNQTMTGRFQTDQGADVASPAGGIMTLGTDGNVFDITGTNTINEILGTTWTLGAQIVLQFDGVLTVTHNSGGTNDILLGNAANMTTAAGNTLSLFYNGTDWVETARNVGDGAGDALVANPLSQFAATTSLQLLGVLSDETGTGSLVFATSPTLVTPVLGTVTSGDISACTSTSMVMVTPALGTPASGVLTNCTIPFEGVTYDINAQTGTTYTFVLGDAGDIVTSSNAATVAMTIPPNSSVAFPIGSSLTVISIGAGLTNFAQGAGVTITSTGATAAAPILRAQYSSATAIKTATDAWSVVGDIA
jgi:hypothetical protein